VVSAVQLAWSRGRRSARVAAPSTERPRYGAVSSAVLLVLVPTDQLRSRHRAADDAAAAAAEAGGRRGSDDRLLTLA